MLSSRLTIEDETMSCQKCCDCQDPIDLGDVLIAVIWFSFWTGIVVVPLVFILAVTA